MTDVKQSPDSDTGLLERFELLSVAPDTADIRLLAASTHHVP
jgi:hypothetical protein